LKRESNLTIKLTRKIEEIPLEDWNKVYPKVLENYHFFKTLDEANFEQFSFYYIIIYEQDTPVAATSIFSMHFALDMMVKGLLKVFLNFIKKLTPNLLSPKVLICGLPMGPGRIGITGEPRPLIQKICAVLEELAKKEKAAMIIFKDFTAVYDDILKVLLKRGYHKIESIPLAKMPINFSSFADYLKTLSPVSRSGLKRNLKKADQSVKIDLEITDALDENTLPKVYELYLETYRRQDLGLEKLPIDFFRIISKNMPNEVKYFLWRIEGKIVAFALCLIAQDYFIDYYLGFDYSVAHQYYLYFVRFRDLLNWCINHGIKEYEMGVTSYEPKRRLGFDFVRLYFYMKHRNKLINLFFDFFSYFFKPERYEPIFKEMNKNRRK